MPLALLTAVAVADPLKRAFAPLAGAVNVMVTPLVGLPLASRAVACNAVAKLVFTAVLCGVPAVAVRLGVPPPAVASAAPLRLTYPEPDVIVHVTVSCCPAVAA